MILNLSKIKTESLLLFCKDLILSYKDKDDIEKYVMDKEIIEKFKHIKNIKLHYCNGSVVQFSRNDLFLNKPITGTTKIEGKFLQLAYKQKSIFPIAFQK
jgi:hypothetical protein